MGSTYLGLGGLRASWRRSVSTLHDAGTGWVQQEDPAQRRISWPTHPLVHFEDRAIRGNQRWRQLQKHEWMIQDQHCYWREGIFPLIDFNLSSISVSLQYIVAIPISKDKDNSFAFKPNWLYVWYSDELLAQTRWFAWLWKWKVLFQGG